MFSCFAPAIKLSDQDADCYDGERLCQADRADQRQQGFLTACIAATGIEDELTETERQQDADCCAAQNQTRYNREK